MKKLRKARDNHERKGTLRKTCEGRGKLTKDTTETTKFVN